MNKNRSPRADGWNVEYVEMLTDELLQCAVDLVAEAEEKGGDWADIMATGITTCAKKDEESEEAEEGEERRE